MGVYLNLHFLGMGRKSFHVNRGSGQAGQACTADAWWPQFPQQ